MEYYFDTYALLEVIEANPSYAEFADRSIITSKLTLIELYHGVFREHGKEKAEFYFDKFLAVCEDIPDAVLKQGVEFRLKFNQQLKRAKKPLSYVDAITYQFAKTKGLKFLTGDETFRGLENVEFVK